MIPLIQFLLCVIVRKIKDIARKIKETEQT